MGKIEWPRAYDGEPLELARERWLGFFLGLAVGTVAGWILSIVVAVNLP